MRIFSEGGYFLMGCKSKKKFRVGQTVQSVYDPTHRFVIDRSLVPERIYREKGTKNWWLKNDLQPFGTPENPRTSLRLNGKGKCAPGISSGLQIVAGVSAGPEERECLECGFRFQPARPWQRFHTEACRRAFGERARKQAWLQRHHSSGDGTSSLKFKPRPLGGNGVTRMSNLDRSKVGMGNGNHNLPSGEQAVAARAVPEQRRVTARPELELQSAATAKLEKPKGGNVCDDANIQTNA